MKPFSPYTRCPKCGESWHIATKHTRLAFERYDVIRRTCKRCEFVWDELPLDRAGAA